ncbi:hypothetical protein ACNQQN_24860 [Mycobacteroides chelonae]|uniref:hypothetical protein n=1 Tax=Mycobacteroides chelonae TaxID=1774 RepID=UPI003AADF0B4
MPKFGFDTGGYTGNVPINRIAGVVHGDEFVIKSKSRKGIENAHPGLLDYLNANWSYLDMPVAAWSPGLLSCARS